MIYRIKNKISQALDRIASKIMSKLTEICNNDSEQPEVCECENALLGEINFPVNNPAQLITCKPSRCKCSGSDEWIKIHPGKLVFNQLMGRICNPNDEVAVPNFSPELPSKGYIESMPKPVDMSSVILQVTKCLVPEL